MFVYVQENQLLGALENISKIEIVEYGTFKDLKNIRFESTLLKLKNLFSSARLMPAFGVSLHQETLDALNAGQWLKISFSHEQNVNGLLFDALVFQLSQSAGLNLIREYNGKYEGRCIYLDFDEETNLKDLIK